MKATKRAFCPVCKSRKYVSTPADLKTDKEGNSLKLRCKKDGTALRIVGDWYVIGRQGGKDINQNCGSLKKDADDFIAACRMAVRSGSVLPGRETDISWADAVKNCDGVHNKKDSSKDCDGWWDDALTKKSKGRIKAGTRKHYSDQIVVLDKYLFGTSLLTITRATVENIIKKMDEDEYAPASIGHAIKTLKRMYAMHLENLALEDEPRPKLMEKAFIISKVEIPDPDNEKTVSCDAVDMHKVLAVIQNGQGRSIDKQRLRLAIMLGVGMLMRPININALEWSEIDFDNGVIRIDKEKMKGKRDFEQAIPHMIIDELRAWRLVCGLSSRYVFPSPKKQQGDPDQPMQRMSKAITSWIKKAGLNPAGVGRKEKITPYVLTRHTGATELYEESGENLEMVSKTAAHADSRITRKRYVKNRVEFAKRTVVPIQEAVIRRMMGEQAAA